MATHSLTVHFQSDYLQGKTYTGNDYVRKLWHGVRVLEHVPTGIQVCEHALDVRRHGGSRACVLFHYTSESAFRSITAFCDRDFKLWASQGAAESNFGFGVYATSGEPASWGSKDCIYLNNYWPRRTDQPEGLQAGLTLEEHLGTQVHDHIMNQFRGRADFCIAIICDDNDAYDVRRKCTPKMTLAGARPGQNRWREDEPRWRNVWVVVLGSGGDLTGAPAKLEAVMKKRVEYHRRHHPSHETRAEVTEELADFYLCRGAWDKAEPLLSELRGLRETSTHHDLPRHFEEPEPRYHLALPGHRQGLGNSHPSTLTNAGLPVGALVESGWQGAEAVCQEPLALYTVRYGHSHVPTLTSRSILHEMLAGHRESLGSELEELVHHGGQCTFPCVATYRVLRVRWHAR